MMIDAQVFYICTSNGNFFDVCTSSHKQQFNLLIAVTPTDIVVSILLIIFRQEAEADLMVNGDKIHSHNWLVGRSGKKQSS